MAEVDLGLRLFLNDMASTGLLSFNGLLGGFGQTIMGLVSQSMGLSTTLDDLNSRMVKLESAFLAGTINAQTYADASGVLNQGIADTSAQLATLQTALVGVGIAAGGALDLSLFSSALQTATQDAADFQDAMAKVSIGVSGTDQLYGEMSGYLTNLANNSIYSTTELADGFQILGERGYTAAQIMQGNMGASLTNLSEAIGANSGSGVVGAAGLLSTAMELFHAQFQDSAHYADLLTYAFYNGIPSADSLRSALEAVGGRAQLLGIPMDQVVVALDALARSGMQGAQAGASLNYFLTALSSPIPKAQAELSSLGLLVVNQTTPAFKGFEQQLWAAQQRVGQTKSVFDGSVKSLQNMFTAAQNLGLISLDANFQQWALKLGILNSAFYDSKGHFVGLVPALDILNQKLKGMNPEQQASVLSNLFNVKSGQGAVQLIDNLTGLHQNYQKLTKSADAHNLAQTDASKITDTWNSSLKQLSTTWTDFMKGFGLPLIQALTPVVQGINGFIGSLTLMGGGFSQFGARFLVIGAVLSVIAIIVGGVIAVIAFAGTAIGAALLPVIGVVLGVAAAIPLLALGISALWGWLEKMGVLKTVAGWFQVLGNYLGKIFGPLFSELGKNLSQAGGLLSDMGTMISHSFAQMQQAIKPLLPALGYIAIGIGVLVGAAVALLAGVFMGILRGLLYGFTALLTGVIMIVAGIIRVFAGLIQFFHGIAVFFTGLWIGITTGNWSTLQKGLHMMWSGIVNIFIGGGQMVLGVVIGIFGTIGAVIWGFIQGLIGFFMHLWDVLVGHSIIPDMLKAILAWFVRIFLQVTSTVLGWVVNITGVFASIPGKVMNALSSLGSMLLNAGGNMMKMLAQGITNGISWVTNAVGGAANAIKNFLGFHSPPSGGPLTDSDQYMPNMMKMYATGITKHTPLLQSAVAGAATALSPRTFTSPAMQSMNTAYAASGMGAGGVGGGHVSTVNLNVDGKCVAQATMNWITGQMQMNGSNRTMR